MLVCIFAVGSMVLVALIAGKGAEKVVLVQDVQGVEPQDNVSLVFVSSTEYTVGQEGQIVIELRDSNGNSLIHGVGG